MTQDWDPTGQTDGPKKGDIVTATPKELMLIMSSNYGFVSFNGQQYDIVKHEIEVDL